MAQFKYILFFNQISIESLGEVGGKNASLGEMYNQLNPIGISIPNGFAITAEGYRLFRKENNPSGELAKYTTSKIDGWYSSKFKEISAELVSMDNLDSDFALYVELIGIHYGKLKGTTPVAPQNGEQKLDSAMIRQMMNQQKVKTDSIKKK